jgi:hypothetical protein
MQVYDNTVSADRNINEQKTLEVIFRIKLEYDLRLRRDRYGPIEAMNIRSLRTTGQLDHPPT